MQWQGRILKVDHLAASIPAADRKELRIGDRRQWYFTVTLEIPDVKHKVRIMVLWRDRHDPEPVKILVTNRTTWEVGRGVRVSGYALARLGGHQNRKNGSLPGWLVLSRGWTRLQAMVDGVEAIGRSRARTAAPENDPARGHPLKLVGMPGLRELYCTYVIGKTQA